MSNITRYFHAENCRRTNIPKFDAYEMRGGTWCGVTAVEAVAQIEALDALAKDPKSAIKEITEEEYLRITKKVVAMPVPAPEAMVQKAVTGAPVESPEAALQVGTVPPVNPPAETTPTPPVEGTTSSKDILLAKSAAELREIIGNLNAEPERAHKITVAGNASKVVMVDAILNATGYKTE